MIVNDNDVVYSMIKEEVGCEEFSVVVATTWFGWYVFNSVFLLVDSCRESVFGYLLMIGGGRT